MYTGRIDSVSNPYSQPNFNVSECNSNYRSTFSNNTCSLSEPRSRSQSLPRFPPLSPIPSLPHLLFLEITTTKDKDLNHSSAQQKIIAKTLNPTLFPSRSRSRSTSLPRSPPLSSTPSLPHLLSLEVNQTKNKDLHRSNVKKKIIAKTLDPSLNHPSPTNTIKYRIQYNRVLEVFPL